MGWLLLFCDVILCLIFLDVSICSAVCLMVLVSVLTKSFWWVIINEHSNHLYAFSFISERQFISNLSVFSFIRQSFSFCGSEKLSTRFLKEQLYSYGFTLPLKPFLLKCTGSLCDVHLVFAWVEGQNTLKGLCQFEKPNFKMSGKFFKIPQEILKYW